MTNAAQGNPLIPSHPTIQAQHAQTGAPAPSNPAAPAASPAAPAAAEIDWLAMMDGNDTEEPQAVPPAPNGAQAPTGQPPAQQPSELTAEQRLAIAESQGAPAQAAPTAPTPPVDANQAVAQAERWLLDNTYKMDDEQKKKLISEPDVAIPQLAARMHVQIATQMAQYMQQAMQTLVPQMAVSAMQKQMGAFKAEQSFFSQYPALARAEYRPVVLKMLQTAKAMSPQADRATIMKDAAEMAAFKLKFQLTQPQAAPPQSQQQPRYPQTPAQMPFVPATGGAPPAAQSAPQANIFEELAMDPNF